MHPEERPVAAIAARLQERFGQAPDTAIVLGSGLGVVVDRLEVVDQVPSVDFGLPQSSVPGHAGSLVVGTLGGARVVVLSGRVHMYEGYSAWETVRYVRAFHRWGVQRLLLTCSAGGIGDGMDTGVVMLLTDHINLQRENPLTGPAWSDIRFPDLTEAYDLRMREVLLEEAERLGQHLAQGVYISSPGPAYETPAETRMLKLMGADAVGMSTVPEVLAASELQLPVAALAVISNRAAGLADGPLTHDEVTEIAHIVGERVAALLARAVPRF